MVGCLKKVSKGGTSGDWDKDHIGFAGWATPFMLKNIKEKKWHTTYKPDIVLIHLGTNGTPPKVSKTTDDIGKMIDLFREANPKVICIVAIILGTPTKGEAMRVKIWKDLAADIPRLKEKSTKESPVIIVDQRTGVIRDIDTADGVHPSKAGAIKLADRWYAELVKVMKK